MRFSERMGYRPVADTIQTDGMSDELRNGLWNVLVESEFPFHRDSDESSVFRRADLATYVVWVDYLKEPLDERPQDVRQSVAVIRKMFFTCEWYLVYDFIEFCVGAWSPGMIPKFNAVLERELSGYRIVGGKVAPITSPDEIQAVQTAVDGASFPGAGAHLRRALELLSDRTSPDYRNSIKESVSAVESACCAITGDRPGGLAAALAKIESIHGLHGALKAGFTKLYGYTSDEGGIRHAMLEGEAALTQADALYFLVSCSAFVNYLKAKAVP